MSTVIQQIAQLSLDQQTSLVDGLSEAELYDLLYSWEHWARSEQLTPDGDWNVWLYLAGRGAGKTRTDAEDFKKYGIENKESRLAIIAPTYQDARDTCIEGESGLLSVLPPDKVAAWNRSLGELVLTNGTRYKLFSAEEPDRLRGPQHHRLWCLAGDTPVLLSDGSEKPIADIRVGDYVMTRRGPRRVKGHCLTKQKSEVYLLRILDGRSIIGTAEHPVWVQGRGFVPMALLSKGMSLCVTHALNGMAIPGINVLEKATTNDASCSTVPFGSKLMGRFQRGTIFTTKTGTRPIIASKIWNYLHIVSIVLYTSWRKSAYIERRLSSTQKKPLSEIIRYVWNAISFALSVGECITVRPFIPRAIARQRVLNRLVQGHSMVSLANVSTVPQNITQPSERNATAQSGAITVPVGKGRGHSLSECLNALNALLRFNRNVQTPVSVATIAPLLFTQTIASVEKLASRCDVYDIAVEDAHEFFAQGILVHNCEELCAWKYLVQTWDNAMFGLRLGQKPQAIISTTPKPSKFLRELMKRLDVHVTRGSTFDNTANLAPAALEHFKRRYLNTRTGRQELFAEVLDDAQGALWKREEMIEAYRVTEYPPLIRIVVAIDPAVADVSNRGMDELDENEGSETGIVVAGIAANGHGYVLDDKSLRASPLTWGMEAITAYHKYRADRIVGERNNGGALVEANIRAADVKSGNVSYSSVWASRGKYTRAEPVASLYEQGKVHHVGMFPVLEDQMCQWEVLTGQKSPDRLDALVWALTELMCGEGDIEPLDPDTSLAIREYAGY